MYRFSQRWLFYFNIVVGIYVGLPILAPMLMNSGATAPAQAIYTIYSPMCHQMASRSFFLFGEQNAYPRALAGTNLQPLEAYTAQLDAFDEVREENWAQFFLAARRFVGNEQMGYKMALCERDIAIYSFVFLAGLLYAGLRRRYQIKPLPIWLFILVGMGPIGWDGFSQLFSYYALPLDGSAPEGIRAVLANLFPLRESTPLLRSGTGALFGFMLAWLIYPHVDDGMKLTERDMGRRLKELGEL
jgi:uncharacterized membrane protein